MDELISVILPVYNCEKYVADAIMSICTQTYQNWELIIVDDCSTDNTRAIIEGISAKDMRIRVLLNQHNSGIVCSLNRGIAQARGTFYARMDADDIAMPERLETQLRYMLDHPEVIIASCWFEMFGDASGVVRYPEQHEKICADFLFGNRFLHPGYFIRARAYKECGLFYDEHMKYVEDYDIAVRASTCGKLANVPRVLMKYRVHANQTTKTHNARQAQLCETVYSALLNRLGIVFSTQQERIYHKICYSEDIDGCSADEIKNAIVLYKFILEHNNERCVFDKHSLKKIVSRRAYLLLRSAHQKKIIRSCDYTSCIDMEFGAVTNGKLLLALARSLITNSSK